MTAICGTAVALSLSQSEREHLALTVWASLESEKGFDPDGIELALSRNQEIESGQVQAISHSEFLLLTGGK